MLKVHMTADDAPIRRFLPTREGPATRLLRRHDHLDLVEGECQEAQILEQPAPCGQGVRGRLSNALIVRATGVGLTEKENHERGVDEQHVFHRVAFFLAAITARLFKRVLGAPDAPLRAIGPKGWRQGPVPLPRADWTSAAAPPTARP
jgi:hypothetical protein